MIMKKKGILLSAVILLGTAGLIQAQQGELHGVVDVTYQSKFIWRGFDVYEDKSAIQPAIDVDLFGTGFGINVTGHRANSSGFEDSERWDYNLYYQNRLFGDESYATNYRLGWVYYNYPDQPSKGSPMATNASLQELHAILSLPKICPAGVVPTYVLVKLWPSESNSFSGARSPLPGNGTASGWAHIFMLDYAWPLVGLLPDIPEQVLNFHAELVYNDGVGPVGQDVDHDWSNFVVGVSTDFDLGYNFSLTPGVYHQITMERSLQPDVDKDETWGTFSAKYKF
jgi:hypothetical protein